MSVLVSTGSLAWFRLPVRLAIAQAAGADGIEFLLTSRSSHRGVQTVQELASHYGLPVLSVHAVLRIGSAREDLLAEDLVHSARLAAQLGSCAVLVVHPPSTGHRQARSVQRWFDGIARARQIASDSRFRLALENVASSHRKPQGAVFEQLEYLMRVAEEWDLDFTLDTAHAASTGWDLLATAEWLFPRLANIHLSDAGIRDYPSSLANELLRDHRLPGRGVLPLAPLLELLQRRAYRGFVTLELSPLAFGFPSRARVTAQLRNAVAFCRQYQQPGAGKPPPGQPQRSRESS
jgi:sugar phosphate isomerase/epimerase